jgi:hypothetical protein
MHEASRSFVVFVVLAFVLVAGWLLVGQPQPKSPDRSATPFAPIESIQPARDASSVSDEANRRLQAAGDQAGAP